MQDRPNNNIDQAVKITLSRNPPPPPPTPLLPFN